MHGFYSTGQFKYISLTLHKWMLIPTLCGLLDGVLEKFAIAARGRRDTFGLGNICKTKIILPENNSWNAFGSQIDGSGSNMSDSEIFLKGFSLIIHIILRQMLGDAY